MSSHKRDFAYGDGHEQREKESHRSKKDANERHALPTQAPFRANRGQFESYTGPSRDYVARRRQEAQEISGGERNLGDNHANGVNGRSVEKDFGIDDETLSPGQEADGYDTQQDYDEDGYEPEESLFVNSRSQQAKMQGYEVVDEDRTYGQEIRRSQMLGDDSRPYHGRADSPYDGDMEEGRPLRGDEDQDNDVNVPRASNPRRLLGRKRERLEQLEDDDDEYNHSIERSQSEDDDRDFDDRDYEPSFRSPTRGARKSVRFSVPLSSHPRRPSRASGYQIKPAGINKPAKLVETDSISNASLLKRGLTRAKAPTMSKRACGVNDPENIQIINMWENDGYSFQEIADVLNQERVRTGRPTRHTPNSVHNRYNRNAPLHFQAEGKEFIPIIERKRRGLSRQQGLDRLNWTDEMDLLLVETHKAVEAQFWYRVVAEFESRGGFPLSPMAAAMRMKSI